MPPNRRRQQRSQQHRGQRQRRQRRYVSGGQGQTFKPGFPMNLFTGRAALATFAAVGVVLMVAGISLAAFLPNRGGDADIDEIPTAPAAEETVAAEPDEEEDPSDVIVRNYPAADFVIKPEFELYTATISTSRGDIVIELFADTAPNTVNSFVFLAENRFFDGLVFHRVVENFVVQGGDPTGTGRGGPGYITGDEPNEVRNEAGTVAMAKGAGQPYFGSQFFINLKDNPALDFDAGNRDSFYPFGRVIDGIEVVNAIAEGDVMESVTITRAPNPDAPTPEPEAEEGAEGDDEGEAAGEDGSENGEAGDEDAGN
ncbi:MAG: peptidylprolyl isomerase [Chloroflexota bacterium]|nr:peptidylprolyl isomerase [Chloroflexota bacterium]